MLRTLPESVGPEKLAQLDAAFSLTASGNYEILAQWLEVGVRRGYGAVDTRLEQFLATVGPSRSELARVHPLALGEDVLRYVPVLYDLAICDTKEVDDGDQGVAPLHLR